MEKPDALVGAVKTGGAKTFKRISERIAELEAEGAEREEQPALASFEACRIKEETLSVETMAQTFKTFGQIIKAATRISSRPSFRRSPKCSGGTRPPRMWGLATIGSPTSSNPA